MKRQATPKDPPLKRRQRLLAYLCSLALGVPLMLAVFPLPLERGLAEAVWANLEASGVEHDVTAVLLNFRAYDTMLEMAVLLLSVMAIFAVERRLDLRDLEAEPQARAVLLDFVKPLVPLVVLVSGYVLWLGKTDPGGAFQGGVILAAGGLLLKLCGTSTVSRLSRRLLYSGLVLGVAGFVLLAFVRLAGGHLPLELPLTIATELILGLETLMLLSVAVTALTLVVAAESLGT